MRQLRKQARFSQVKIAAIILTLLLLGGFGYWQFLQQSSLRPVVRGAQPQEKHKKSDNASLSQFAPLSEEPTRLIIDKINVDAKIEPLGLDEQGRMAAPATNEGVGWYNKSAKAGEHELAMLLDGHYGIGNKPGVFRQLDQLKPQDSIKVQGDAGTLLEYEVVETLKQDINEVDMRKALFPYREGVQSLTIITCEGTYDAAQETYDKRTVLYAERIR